MTTPASTAEPEHVPYAEEVGGVVTLAGLPEALLGVTTLQVGDDAVTGTMAAGPWLSWDGHGDAAAGSLGLLVDDVFAYAIVRRQPAGTSSVTTEISVDFLGPVPASGRLHARGELVHLDDRGGLARGEVRTDDGQLVAVAMLRGRFVPADPATVPPPVGVDDDVRRGGLARLLWPDGDGPRAGAPLAGVPVGPRLCNHLGILHGGVSIMLCDLAATTAAARDGGRLSPASLHLTYLRPVPLGARVSLETVVVHRGRTSGIVTVQAHAVTGKPAFASTVVLH